MEALSTTGQECYCSAVTVSSSTQTCNVPQALPAPRPPHQTHSHTQSRCQPILSLPAATNRNWPPATDDAQKPLGKTPSGAGQTQPPLLQYRTNDSAQGTPPPSAAVKAVLSQDLTAEHTAGMTLYSMWPLSSEPQAPTNMDFLHPSPSRMAHVLYKEGCRIMVISRVLSK